MKMYSEDALSTTHNSLLQALLEDIGTKWMLHVVHFQVVDFERQELEHWIQWKWWKKKACIEKQSVTNYERKGA